MSLKKLLGLELFPLHDSEIMRRLAEARQNNVEVVEFSSGIKKVRVKLTPVQIDGLMSGYKGYFNDNP